MENANALSPYNPPSATTVLDFSDEGRSPGTPTKRNPRRRHRHNDSLASSPSSGEKEKRRKAHRDRNRDSASSPTPSRRSAVRSALGRRSPEVDSEIARHFPSLGRIVEIKGDATLHRRTASMGSLKSPPSESGVSTGSYTYDDGSYMTSTEGSVVSAEGSRSIVSSYTYGSTESSGSTSTITQDHMSKKGGSAEKARSSVSSRASPRSKLGLGKPHGALDFLEGGRNAAAENPRSSVTPKRGKTDSGIGSEPSSSYPTSPKGQREIGPNYLAEQGLLHGTKAGTVETPNRHDSTKAHIVDVDSAMGDSLHSDSGISLRDSSPERARGGELKTNSSKPTARTVFAPLLARQRQRAATASPAVPLADSPKTSQRPEIPSTNSLPSLPKGSQSEPSQAVPNTPSQKIFPPPPLPATPQDGSILVRNVQSSPKSRTISSSQPAQQMHQFPPQDRSCSPYDPNMPYPDFPYNQQPYPYQYPPSIPSHFPYGPPPLLPIRSPSPRMPDTGKKTISGYEMIASKLSSIKENKTPLVPLYRKFEMLNHRLLLHMQDELAELEEELRRVDEADSQTRIMAAGLGAGQPGPASRRAGAQVKGDLEMRRLDVLGSIYTKIGQYNQALTSYGGLVKTLDPAKGPDIERYRMWMSKHQPIAEQETRFLKHDKDLVAVDRSSSATAEAWDPLESEMVMIAAAACTVLVPIIVFKLVSSLMNRMFATLVLAGCVGGVMMQSKSLKEKVGVYLGVYVGVIGVLACLV